MLNVVVLSAIFLSVVMPKVVAPNGNYQEITNRMKKMFVELDDFFLDFSVSLSIRKLNKQNRLT
jgi:hypothetical protein